MIAPIRFSILFSILGSLGLSQDQASTLARLTDRSDAVALVRVVSIRDQDSLHHRVLFATQALLKGALPPSFEIIEPAGRGCGRALAGLPLGVELVAFLVRQPGGLRLAVSSARSLAVGSPRLVTHVQDLVRTGVRGRVTLLAGALSSGDERVRRDAALTLPTLARLEEADDRARAQILAALPGLLDQRDRAAAELVMAVVRLGLHAALDGLVTRYLDGRDPELLPVYREAIAQLGMEAAARRVAENLPVDPAGQKRAVELLSDLPVPESRQALMGLLSGSTRPVARRAVEALLASGMARQELGSLASEDLLDEAEERLGTPGRFRSILRGGRR